MRKHVPSPHAGCASSGVTRRRFVRSAAATALAMAGLRHGAVPALASAAPGAWWTRAHAVAASGALGTLRWVEACYPAAARATGAAWAAHVGPILAAIGAPATPCRTSTIGSGAPTVVLEFDAAPSVFLAPAAASGGFAQVVVRGSRASLRVHDDRLWLRPESPRAQWRRL